ncbi:hypothetical protein RGQ29_030843 [Quercus rubra]|uniref:Cytochrome b5 heme-binding domain-containing protein n=1 Tax=Quercus rubra TaxID=3512 RepID=A0AAN7EIY0_QUERU|nr:hypothetical protein RGQ29_030843 [Quercus rubra]
MEKGKGVMVGGRRWGVDFTDNSASPSSRDILDPPGFSRASQDQDDSTLSRQKKDAEANWKSQLTQYNGTDASKPLYVAVKGRIFDVTNGKSFYGPGGPYAMFAGKDASRALAKMSKNDEDVTPSLDGLSDKEIGVLNDWEKKFEAKYPVVGRVVS